MPPTLITGAPGWIGTRLARVLRQGLSVGSSIKSNSGRSDIRCLVLPGVDLTPIQDIGKIDTISGDLRDAAALKAFFKDARGATLFHCAGVIHPRLFVRELFENNVQGTQNLLQAAEAAGVRRVVVLSSNSPFGSNPRREHRFDENSPYHPYRKYGLSKMRMEQVVREYQLRGKLETVILRPNWFYGPDQPERQTDFFRMIKNGMAPILGDGGNLRSMIYIDNLCQAILLSENNKQANGQVYWIADKRPYPMTEIVDTVERLMETEFGIPVAHKRLRLPANAGEVAGWADAILQGLGVYQQKIHVLSEMNKTIACVIDKAQKELNYQPEIELEEGMRRSLAWCKEKGIRI
jgi:nucleoside-diphosphate-sugar epimerase